MADGWSQSYLWRMNTDSIAAGFHPSSHEVGRSRHSIDRELVIARRARAIWKACGKPAGRDEQIWLEAEREVRREESPIGISPQES